MTRPAPAPRPPLHRRPDRAAMAPFDVLDHAHRAALGMLQAFDALVQQLEGTGLDAAARERAREVLAFFDGPGRQHHQDEETHVFPGLLAASDETLVAHVRRLQQDHGWLEADWDELRPHVQAVAEGYNGYDLPMMAAALPVFDALYRDHIALEEQVVYPAARRQKEALLKGRANQPVVL